MNPAQFRSSRPFRQKQIPSSLRDKAKGLFERFASVGTVAAVSGAMFTASADKADGAIYMTQQGVDEGVNFAQQLPEASGYFVGNDSNFGGAINGSSMVLISPNWALTAAHAVDTISNITIGFDSNIFNDPRLGGSAATYAVDEVIINPSFISIGNGYDLALLRLSSPVTDVLPATISHNPITVGTQGFNIGYGTQGVAGQGLQSFDGLERAGTDFIRITDLTPAFSENYFSIRLDGDTPNSTLEWLGSGRDSGGAFYISDGNGGYELAGINSYSTGTGFGSATGFTELDNDWISSYTIPEPQTTTLALAAGALSATRRRRKSKTS